MIVNLSPSFKYIREIRSSIRCLLFFKLWNYLKNSQKFTMRQIRKLYKELISVVFLSGFVGSFVAYFEKPSYYIYPVSTFGKKILSCWAATVFVSWCQIKLSYSKSSKPTQIKVKVESVEGDTAAVTELISWNKTWSYQHWGRFTSATTIDKYGHIHGMHLSYIPWRIELEKFVSA